MKYVLGGGLAGLITAYMNPDHTVITPEVSGFIESKIGRAFVVVHEDDATRQLFTELGVPSFVKEIQLAYFEPSCGLTYDPPDWFGQRYLTNKLPRSMQPDDVTLGGAPGSEFRALFVDENLIEALAAEVDILRGRVTNVNGDELGIDRDDGGYTTREWESVVSTMPADVFRDIVEADVDWKLDHHPMTYMEVERIPDELRTRSWDYLYRVDDRPGTGDYHRVIRHAISSNYFLEYRGAHETEQTFEQKVVNPRGVIAAEDIDSPYDGLRFNGRFAEWNPDLLTNDVIDRATDL